MTDTDRLIYALEFALEMQKTVENYRPAGYGSPRNTVAWMAHAQGLLNLIKPEAA